MKLRTAKTDPQAFTVITSGSIATLLVFECETRLGIHLDIIEAGFIVSAVTFLYFMLMGKKNASSN